MVNLAVPFVSNTPDDKHCYQACIKMLMAYFFPHREITFEELDIITKISHHYTWSYAGDQWLINQGLEIMYIGLFDHERFSNEGGNYLYSYAGDEVAEDQIKNSNIPQEQSLAKDIVTNVRLDVRLPTLGDIQQFLHTDSLLLCDVNSHVLAGEDGYEGHKVLIKGYENDELIIHDPGLPAQENLRVPYKTFENAWAYPDHKVKNLTVYSKAS